MDPSASGGGQQQQRNQQPVYDIRQGGHYGGFANQSPALKNTTSLSVHATMSANRPIVYVLMLTPGLMTFRLADWTFHVFVPCCQREHQTDYCSISRSKRTSMSLRVLPQP
jgi:hypothetical protein